MKGNPMKLLRVILALTLTLSLGLGIYGCQPDPNKQVAATVGGVNIMEADVTTRIEMYRLDQNTGTPVDDATWAAMLSNAGHTPESLREFVIRNNFAIYPLILQKAAAIGITPDAEAVTKSIDEVKTSVQSTGDTFENYLKSQGIASEDAYHQIMEAMNVATAFVEAETAAIVPTQEEIDTYISQQAVNLTGKRISAIILNTDSADNTEAVVRLKAEEALGKIQGGTDFAAVAKEYMATTAPDLAEKGGDIGWGYESGLPTELKAALDALEKDQVSEIVEIRTPQSTGTDTGTGAVTDGATDGTAADASAEPALPDAVSFYIIKWTDEFLAPETDAAAGPAAEGADAGAESAEGATTDPAAEGAGAEGTTAQTEDEAEVAAAAGGTADGAADDAVPTIDVALVPEDLKQELTDAFIEQKKQETQSQYFTELTKSDEIIINPMPAGLSYAVDMSLATAPTDENQPIDEAAESAQAGELVINDLIEGTGAEAKVGDTVEVHYIGTLYDGSETVFDESYGRGEPYELVIGAGSVIQGWEQGLPGMKVGGKRELIIPASLAYGSTGQGSIPPNATLKFVVELVSVNGDSTGYTPSGTADGAADGTADGAAAQ